MLLQKSLNLVSICFGSFFTSSDRVAENLSKAFIQTSHSPCFRALMVTIVPKSTVKITWNSILFNYKLKIKRTESEVMLKELPVVSEKYVFYLWS